MICGAESGPCRERDIARPLGLRPNPKRKGDFEGDCPACGRRGFALSAAKAGKYRNIWSCNYGHGCPAGAIRSAMIKKGIDAGCLGTYDGPGANDIHPDTARKMDLVIRDILAAPHLKPTDIRIALAEARGRVVPEDFTGFVKFAISIGISKTRAQEAAPKYCRPSDCSPQTRGAVTDTSRSTQPGTDVKPGSSEARERSETGNRTAQFGPSDIPDTGRSETVDVQNVRKPETDQRTLDTKKNRRPAA